MMAYIYSQLFGNQIREWGPGLREDVNHCGQQDTSLRYGHKLNALVIAGAPNAKGTLASLSI